MSKSAKSAIVVMALALLCAAGVVVYYHQHKAALDSPLRQSFALEATVEPDCILCGTDPATGAQAMRCRENKPLTLYLDAEIRDDGEVLDSATRETFLKTTITPTLAISATFPVSDLNASGALWLRARLAYDPWSDGLPGLVEKDGAILPQDERGFSYYDDFYLFYAPVIIAVVW
jgi:hypothetical protein